MKHRKEKEVEYLNYRIVFKRYFADSTRLSIFYRMLRKFTWWTVLKELIFLIEGNKIPYVNVQVLKT